MGKSKKSKKHDKQKSPKRPDKKAKKDTGSGKIAKPKKRVVLQDRACPCCKKRCPLTDPKCSKGKAIRKKLLHDAGVA